MKFDYFFRLTEYFPPNKRTQEYFDKAFMDKGLGEVVKLQKAQVRYSMIHLFV